MVRPPLAAACRCAVGLAVAAIVLRTWLVLGLIDPVVVSGSSMSPTLGGEDGGSRVFIDRTAFAFRDPERWEVVVFRCPGCADQLCVKRIIGLPGETVALAGGDVYINGQIVRNPLNRKQLSGQREIHYGVGPGDRPQRVDDRNVADIPWPDPIGPGHAATWQLGPDEYFVIGDNAAVSDDSRSWVPKSGLDAKLLIGKPLGVR
jgi:signal peptidase I